jgi:hypothetical protein
MSSNLNSLAGNAVPRQRDTAGVCAGETREPAREGV